MIEIDLTKGYTAIISDDKKSIVMPHKWHATIDTKGKVYARGYVNRKKVYLHIHICNPGSGEKVDHVDGNGLNCLNENMRICNSQQNSRNRKPTKNKSGYKGVDKHSCGMWRMRIATGKSIISKYFHDEIEAARAYDEKARELFGEFARLNFPV